MGRYAVVNHLGNGGVGEGIWAVINNGKPNQIARRTSAILVGNAGADRNYSDGDDPPNDK